MAAGLTNTLRQVGTATKGTPPPPVYNEPNRPGVDPHGPDESEQVYYRMLVGGFLQPDGISALQPICDDHPCMPRWSTSRT